MSVPPFDLQQQLRKHGEALRALALTLLRDPYAAEDAVQEVWLGTLRAPPRHGASLGGWFAEVLRNTVRRRQHQERRRAAREHVAADRRGAQAEDHRIAVSREECVARLLAAVGKLDGPYREAIWQRYFEGKAPRQIAAACGVPVATIKSRLQRGLSMLREQLDGQRDSVDWRAGLTAAFVDKAGTATAWSVVWLMSAWTKTAVAAVVVVVACMGWWAMQARSSAPPVVLTSAAAADLAATVADPVANSDVASGAAERLIAPPLPVARRGGATLTGRCVDPAHAPLADCVVTLRGYPLGAATPQEWTDLAQLSTGTDGRFAITFAPPPSFRFALQIDVVGRVGAVANWRELAADAVIDVGDVLLHPGVQLTGRVVDEQQRPCAEVRVTLRELLAASDGAFHRDTFVSVTTDADGHFAANKTLPPGYLLATVAGREITPPAPVTLAHEPAAQHVLLVTKPAAAVVKITGTVVDDAGEPIAGAWVETDGGDGPRALSGRGGKFELQQRLAVVREDARIAVRSSLHEPLELDEPVAWGAVGVVLRLQRGAPLTIRVLDEGGAPVDDYAVRVFPVASTIASSDRTKVLARGPFVAGTTTLPSVPIGKWVVWIELPAGTATAWVLAPVEIRDRTPRQVTLQLRQATRTLRVVDRSNSPVADSKVRIADLVEGQISGSTQLFPIEKFAAMSGGSKALLIGEVQTDAGGVAELRGPSDRPVTLWMDGPGHVRMVQRDVSLAEVGELVVRVDRGGTVIGRVGPAQALAEMRRLAGLPTSGSIPAARLTNWAHVALNRADGDVGPNSVRTFPLDEQGGFVATGLLAGIWRPSVSLRGSWVRAADFEVREGQTEEVTLTLDLDAVLPGVLAAQVTWNGAPLANTRVHLRCMTTEQGGAQGFGGEFDALTDAHGRFEHRGRPGEYTLVLQKPGPAVTYLAASTPAQVVRDQTTHHTFAIASGKIELVLLDTQGRPAQIGQLMANATTSTAAAQLARHDESGPFRGELEPGEYELFVLPGGRTLTRLQQQQQPEGEPMDLNEFMRSLRQKIGKVTIVADETASLELRLSPPEFSKRR